MPQLRTASAGTVALLAIALVLHATTFLPAELLAADQVSFERHIMPLLEKRCNQCHHAEEARGGLDLTRSATILRGGDELGPAVITGKPNESPLVRVLTGQAEPAMPDGADPLPESEIELLKNWIQQGAKDDTPQFSDEDVAFFERDIRPVLFNRCFKCHAGDEPESGLQLTSRFGILRGGERGPAAVPGKPDESRILAAVRHAGELQMPRGGDKLSPAQIAAIEEWIRRGLPWPQNQSVLTRQKLFTISEADRNHWAFRALPEQLPRDWNIDNAVRLHQAEAGLQPAPAADKHRLLRRVTFDLIGYPPTPEEIEAFTQDDSPAAYANVVERLLESPHFGWRWGRHWLDYTRNGANGQSNRGPEMDPQRYADWVARCVNEDRPYDWFARVHLAGDRMPAPDGTDYSIDQALAAAVPLNGPRTFQNASTETFVLMDKLDEGIEFMGRSLMGVSLECARCHDHKFDPISQRDYYALLGFFQSSWFGPVPRGSTSRQAADAALNRHRELLYEQARLQGLIRKGGLKINVGGGGLVRKWQESRQAPLAPKEFRVLELEVQILQAELEQAQASGTAPARFLDDLRNTITARQAALKNFQPCRFYVVAFKELGYEIHGHKSQLGLIKRAEDAGLPSVVAELKELDQFWIDERDRWGERQMFGGHRKSDPEVAHIAAWHDEMLKIKVELEQLEASQIVVRCEGGLRCEEDLEPFRQAAADDDRAFYPELLPPYVGDARLLRRGDVLEPDELIKRRFPEFFGGETPESEGSGRLDLANWLTEPGSLQAALVARAAVNRAWQHLFGEGLCRTPKELGRLGEVPEMPDVIDGLAVQFIDSGWSLKSLVREIVLSNAYRQSSIPSDEAFAKDPHNRWFARQSVRRLESEPIMNTMAYLRHGSRHVGPIERSGKLTGSPQFAGTFDAPTTDDLIDRRVASIAPSQALFLMNDKSASSPIVVGISAQLSAEDGIATQLDKIYTFVLSRSPTDAERQFAESFVARRRQQTGVEDAQAELHEFLHLLLCSNELIYLE